MTNTTQHVSRYFVEKKPIWVQNDSLTIPNHCTEVHASLAQYTGGLVQVVALYLINNK